MHLARQGGEIYLDRGGDEVDCITKSFESVLHNCAALQETLISTFVVNYQVTCLEVTTKANEFHAKLDVCFVFCYSGLHQVHSLTGQLSTTLQCMDITATEAKKCAEVL